MLKHLALAAIIAITGCQSVTVTDTPALPPSAAPLTYAAKGAALNGINEVLAFVSPDVLPNKPSGWTDAKIDVANTELARAAGRPITLTLTAEEVIRWEKGYALNGEPAERYDGDIAFWIYFQERNARDAATLNLGQRVTVAGKLNAVRFEQREGTRNVRLYVEVDHAEIIDSVASR